MDYAGQIYKESETEIATLTAAEREGSTIVEIMIGGRVKIRFPLPAGADKNEIELRAANIIDQTNMAGARVRVEVEER